MELVFGVFVFCVFVFCALGFGALWSMGCSGKLGDDDLVGVGLLGGGEL